MARGVSPLQQQILRLAWERNETRHGPYRLLFPHDIFVAIYGWPVAHDTRPAHRRAADLTRYQSWHFQPGVIGPTRYHAAMVTVSRALGRLQARGLLAQYRERGVLYGWGGWSLTEQGRSTVQRFMVDKVAKEEKSASDNQPLTPLND
jgi:hypothetical protein